DEITESFPELPETLAGLPQDAILDGEILAWSYLASDQHLEVDFPGRASPLMEDSTLSPGRALPFSALQQRLGRKKVSEELMHDVPVAYLLFDVLYAGDELLIDRPLHERARILDALLMARNPIHHSDTEIQKKTNQSRLAFEAAAVVPTTDDRRPTTKIIRAPVYDARSPEELNAPFDSAQGRGN